MRILLVHNYYQHRGGEDVVFEQESAMLKEKHEVKTLTFQNKKGIRGLIQFFLYPFNIFAARKVVKEAKEFQADIVHIHNMHYALGPWLIRSLHRTGFKVVMTLHNFRIICPSATLFYNNQLHTESIQESFPLTAVKAKALDQSLIKSFITAFTYWLHKKLGTWNMISQYFTFSDFSKAILVQSTLALRDDSFKIKPNFVEEPSLSKGDIADYYVYIGRLSIEKGITPLLKAFSSCNYKIHIYGTGPLQAEVEHYANQYPNIIYKGYQSKDILQKVLAESKALIVPSICYEGMPMTILDAYAIGTPVLSSNIGILEQMVVPLKTGLHFDPYDLDSIIKSLNKFENIPMEVKAQMIEACRKAYKDNYNRTSNLALLEKTYNNVIISNN